MQVIRPPRNADGLTPGELSETHGRCGVTRGQVKGTTAAIYAGEVVN